MVFLTEGGGNVTATPVIMLIRAMPSCTKLEQGRRGSAHTKPRIMIPRPPCYPHSQNFLSHSRLKCFCISALPNLFPASPKKLFAVRRKARTNLASHLHLEWYFFSIKTLHYRALPSCLCSQIYAMEPAEYEYRSGNLWDEPKRSSGTQTRLLLATCRPERNRWSQTLFHEHREARLKEWIRELEAWGFLVWVDMLQTNGQFNCWSPSRQHDVRKKLDSYLNPNELLINNLDIITDWLVFRNDFLTLQDWLKGLV